MDKYVKDQETEKQLDQNAKELLDDVMDDVGPQPITTINSDFFDDNSEFQKLGTLNAFLNKEEVK